MPDSIEKRKNVLISSSENAIRGLLMNLCDIPLDKIHTLEIPTGTSAFLSQPHPFAVPPLFPSHVPHVHARRAADGV